MNDSNLQFIRDLFCLVNLLSKALSKRFGMLMKNQRFSEALLDAVDFAFQSLGKSCEQSLYFHLKATFHIERTEISDKAKEFDRALKLIFKDGAVFLERLILKKLCEDLKVKFEEESTSDFVEAISKVQNLISENESVLMTPNFGNIATVETETGGEKVGSEG
jgi:hypothetical protein